MSREDIPNILIRLTNVTGYNHSQESNLAFKAATDEIERLLANERERVRKMCSGICENMESWRDWDEIPDLKGSTQAGAAAYYLGNRIRQLDLTKDLAPSSTEEEKP